MTTTTTRPVRTLHTNTREDGLFLLRVVRLYGRTATLVRATHFRTEAEAVAAGRESGRDEFTVTNLHTDRTTVYSR